MECKMAVAKRQRQEKAEEKKKKKSLQPGSEDLR